MTDHVSLFHTVTIPQCVSDVMVKDAKHVTSSKRGIRRPLQNIFTVHQNFVERTRVKKICDETLFRRSVGRRRWEYAGPIFGFKSSKAISFAKEHSIFRAHSSLEKHL